MGKKATMTFLTIIFMTICYGNRDSTLNSGDNNISRFQQKIDSKQDSAIKSILEFEKSYSIKESLFSNQLSILTAIFSTIVAISIFIIGYLIPRLNDEKHKNEIKKLLAEFEAIRDEIKTSRDETAKLEAKNNYNNSKIMFFNCADTNSKHGELLWALRHCKDNFIRFNDPNDKDVEFYIGRAQSALEEIPKNQDLKEYVDEINGLVAELIEMYSIDGIEEKLIFIKEEYNKIAWTKVEK